METLDLIGDQVWDDMTEEWAEHMFGEGAVLPCEHGCPVGLRMQSTRCSMKQHCLETLKSEGEIRIPSMNWGVEVVLCCVFVCLFDCVVVVCDFMTLPSAGG